MAACSDTPIANPTSITMSISRFVTFVTSSVKIDTSSPLSEGEGAPRGVKISTDHHLDTGQGLHAKKSDFKRGIILDSLNINKGGFKWTTSKRTN